MCLYFVSHHIYFCFQKNFVSVLQKKEIQRAGVDFMKHPRLDFVQVIEKADSRGQQEAFASASDMSI